MAKAIIIQFFFQGIGLEIRADQAFGLSLWCFTQKHDRSWVVSMSKGGNLGVISEISSRQIEKWLPHLLVLPQAKICFFWCLLLKVAASTTQKGTSSPLIRAGVNISSAMNIAHCFSSWVYSKLSWFNWPNAPKETCCHPSGCLFSMQLHFSSEEMREKMLQKCTLSCWV